MSGNAFCLGLGVGTKSAKGEWLEVFYAQPIYEPCNNLLKTLTEAVDYAGGNQAIELDAESLQKVEDAFAAVHAEDQQSEYGRAARSDVQPQRRNPAERADALHRRPGWSSA